MAAGVIRRLLAPPDRSIALRKNLGYEIRLIHRIVSSPFAVDLELALCRLEPLALEGREGGITEKSFQMNECCSGDVRIWILTRPRAVMSESNNMQTYAIRQTTPQPA